MPSLQSGLAEFIVHPPETALSVEVLAAANHAITDAIAAILAGTTSELAPALMTYIDRFAVAGSSPVLGTTRHLSSDRAALANATFGHSMDFDDTVSLMPGHPGVVIVSALLASLPPETAGGRAETVGGREFLRAFVVGYEVATKLGASVGMGHYNRGWHSTGTIGVFGAFAAVACLQKLDHSQVVNGLGIVSSMAAGLRVNFGTMSKPLHSGWAASSGVTAAQLASVGFTGHHHALDGDEGFLAVYGTPESTPEALLPSLGSPFTLVSPGIAMKKYPCCYALHRVIDGLESIRAEVQLTPATVKALRARVAPGSLKPVPYLRPTTGMEARFSMPYVLAVGALDGDFGMAAFTDEAVARPEIRGLMERTAAVEDPACSPDDPRGMSRSAGTRGHVVVTVELVDGSVHERVVETPPGSPDRPLTLEQLAEKFNSCAERTPLSNDQVERALSMLGNLASVYDVSVLAECVALPAADEDRSTLAAIG
jgi:2-methylcitrate dehydratase PrpD